MVLALVITLPPACAAIGKPADARSPSVGADGGEKEVPWKRVAEKGYIPKLGAEQIYLGVSVATGFLELLEEQGRAVSESRDGIVFFKRTGEWIGMVEE